MKKLSKILALIMAVSMMVLVFTACSNSSNTESPAPTGSQAADPAEFERARYFCAI